MASSAVPENSTVGGAGWHESSSVPGWRWRGNPGPDTLLAHMWAYPLVYDLIAEGEGQKQDVSQLIESIVGRSKRRIAQPLELSSN